MDIDELTKNLFLFAVLFFYILKISSSVEFCDSLPSVPNARPENATPPFELGRGVRYICNQNYKENGGTQVAICQINNGTASFTGPSFFCEHVGCGDLPILPNISPENAGNQPFPVGTSITYKCSLGYRKVQGTNAAVCARLVQDGEPEWSVPSLECTGVNCGDPGQTPHATRKGTLFTFPNNVIYECDEGYEFETLKPGLFCLANGQWSASVPKCNIVTCPDLPQIPNGDITYSETDRRYQSFAEYNCKNGFKLNTSKNKRRCTSEKNWDGTEPACDVVRCSPISSLKNGKVIYNANVTEVGELIIVKCNPPDTTTKTLRCKTDGTWSEPLPVCSSPDGERPTAFNPIITTIKPDMTSTIDVPGILCEDPGVIENGYLIDKTVFPTNLTITYGCKEGFAVTGTGKLTCQRDGTWSPGIMPKCKKRLSIEIIAGIAVGVVSVLILIVGGIIYYLKKKKSNSVGNPGLKNKALSIDAKHVDEIRHLDKDKKPIPVTSL